VQLDRLLFERKRLFLEEDVVLLELVLRQLLGRSDANKSLLSE
jgi:hypothetical protein